MANFLISFLDANGILSNFQFGFRHKHSTTHAIITLTERISKRLTPVKLYVVYLLSLEKLLMLYTTYNFTKETIFLWNTWKCV